jgi:hypothetical protein
MGYDIQRVRELGAERRRLLARIKAQLDDAPLHHLRYIADIRDYRVLVPGDQPAGATPDNAAGPARSAHTTATDGRTDGG